MGMHVDSAREYILTCRIDNLSRIFSRQALSKSRNLPVIDRNVAAVGVGCGSDATINDDGVKAHDCVFSSSGEVEILC
jgi:hypothetical protein